MAKKRVSYQKKNVLRTIRHTLKMITFRTKIKIGQNDQRSDVLSDNFRIAHPQGNNVLIL